MLLHQDAQLRSRLVDAGASRIKGFTWRKAALAVAKACGLTVRGQHA